MTCGRIELMTRRRRSDRNGAGAGDLFDSPATCWGEFGANAGLNQLAATTGRINWWPAQLAGPMNHPAARK